MEEQKIELNENGLYKVDTYTDMENGEIRHCVAVTTDGSEPQHKDKFIGVTNIMTPNGVAPLNFELDASTLKEAIEVFPDSAKDRIEKLAEELKKAMEDERFRNMIVRPDGKPAQKKDDNITLVK